MNPTASTVNELMARLDAIIEQTPEPTPEELASRQERAVNESREALRAAAIGESTGWPKRYFEAVETPPEGKEWLAAFETAREFLRGNGILVLYGKRGCGKTRMAAELALTVGRSQYRTAMRFFLDVRATFGPAATQTESDIINELTSTRLLILDEIQERGETAFEDRRLTHVIDNRYAEMRPTILIANLTKRELADSLGPSIVDRARENGKSIEFNWQSYRGSKP